MLQDLIKGGIFWVIIGPLVGIVGGLTLLPLALPFRYFGPTRTPVIAVGLPGLASFGGGLYLHWQHGLADMEHVQHLIFEYLIAGVAAVIFYMRRDARRWTADLSEAVKPTLQVVTLPPILIIAFLAGLRFVAPAFTDKEARIYSWPFPLKVVVSIILFGLAVSASQQLLFPAIWSACAAGSRFVSKGWRGTLVRPDPKVLDPEPKQPSLGFEPPTQPAHGSPLDQFRTSLAEQEKREGGEQRLSHVDEATKGHEPTTLELLTSEAEALVPVPFVIYCLSPAAVRLANALSANSVIIAGRMVHNIIKECAKHRWSAVGYPIEWRDAALFEMVAFCHAYLEHLGAGPQSTASRSPDSSYDQATHQASALTAGLLAREMVPKVDAGALPLRVAEYRKRIEAGLDEAFTETEWSLARAFRHGETSEEPGRLPVLDLAGGQALRAMVMIEFSAWMSFLIDTSRDLRVKGDGLLRHWNANASQREGDHEAAAVARVLLWFQHWGTSQNGGESGDPPGAPRR